MTGEPLGARPGTVLIKWLVDWGECETCGPSYSEGAAVSINGVEVINYQPVANCCGGKTWDRDSIYAEIFERLGYDLTDTDPT